jgi:hypothetical protein
MQAIWLALLIAGASVRSSSAQSNDQTQPVPPPAPAFGQNAPILSPENPPVTSLDVPVFELNTASRSFVSPALQVSESGDTNAGNQFGHTGLESITRVIGAFDLQQFWPKSDLFLEYLGGAAFYGSPYDVKQIQAAGLEATTRWRTGQATLRDAFSYLPDGSFQIGTYGGMPGLGLATGAGSGLGGALPGSTPPTLGSIGNVPRLANNAIGDVVQAITPVSAITGAFGFSNVHFYDPSNPPTLLNGDQYTVQGGYSHLLSRHDQIGIVYGFQLFQFPEVTGGQIYNHIVNVRWSHTITGRLSLVAGAGPQYTDFQESGDAPHWSVSARVQLRYKFARSYLAWRPPMRNTLRRDRASSRAPLPRRLASDTGANWDALGRLSLISATPITKSSRASLEPSPQTPMTKARLASFSVSTWDGPTIFSPLIVLAKWLSIPRPQWMASRAEFLGGTLARWGSSGTPDRLGLISLLAASRGRIGERI